MRTKTGPHLEWSNYQAPGLYALGLLLPHATEIRVGALGTWPFPAGGYVYVGSARGSGGLAARVRRHLRGGKVRHWHIDYLRAVSRPIALWMAPGARDECSWARHLLAQPGAEVIVPGFGASDCACPAHLAHLGEPELRRIAFPGADVWWESGNV